MNSIVSKTLVMLYLLCATGAGAAHELFDSTTFFPEHATIIDSSQNQKIVMVCTPGSSIKTVYARFSARATPQKVFGVITSFAQYPLFMPQIKKTEQLDSSLGAPVWKFWFGVGPFSLTYTLAFSITTMSGGLRCSWVYQTGALRNTTGFWQVQPDVADSTRCTVYYTVFTDPGRFVPASMATYLTTRSIPDVITAVCKRSRQSGASMFP